MKICFVCLGNICRSPMAEFILKDLLKKNNIDNVYVSSLATCYDEDGNDMYYLAKSKLDEKGIGYTKRESKRLEKEDYDKYDLFIGMDDNNIRNIIDILGIDKDKKIRKLLDRDIKDPWYTRDFETAYNDIYEGCLKLLKIFK